MDSKNIISIQQLENKFLLRKLYSNKPLNEYENLVSLFLNLSQFENEENDGLVKKSNYSKSSIKEFIHYFS